MRKFFITDIHGDYKGLNKLLSFVKFNPQYDQLTVGGDMIDRGKDSAKVVKSIKDLCDNYPDKVQAVMGNHEEMMKWYLAGQSRMWLIHGGAEAIQSFTKEFSNQDDLKIHLDWAVNLPLYLQDDSFTYTHAGINPTHSLEEQSREVLWLTEREFYQFSKSSLLKLTMHKPIIHGHTPVERIIFDGSRMNCDLGSETYPIIHERGLGLVELNTMEYYVYKSVDQVISKYKISMY
ncbi:metallophosphoesterase (plasmid) [Paenibacillus thiaminolyticus]|uniref:metallophosphoesterase n=1 Tax=Paenibacillus thiaminolyticus TaxID=49283 RepID=UPI00232C5945|nr:metallophosphoesterase [Paenibacillus thiaminolyticus]WCF11516.1 metallophosphoesterase [Paenibacillus thiaminolyticus]